jgi:amidase
VLENALFLQAIAGADGIDDRQGPGCPFPDNVPDYPALAQKGVEGLKVGLLTEGFSCPMHDKRVSEAVEQAAQRLTSLGATVEHVSVPMHSEAHNLWAIIGRMSATVSWSGKACGRHQLYMNDLTPKLVPMTQEKFDHLFPSGVNTFVNGEYAWKHMPPTLLGKAYNLVRKLRDDYNGALAKYDVLVMPTIPFMAPKLAEPNAGPTELMKSATGLTTNTSPFNLVSGCAAWAGACAEPSEISKQRDDDGQGSPVSSVALSHLNPPAAG